MSAINQWVLLICTLCVLYSILESILPEKQPFNVIKFVCVIYIIISIISPSQTISLDNLSFEIVQEQEIMDTNIDNTQVIIKNAENIVNKELMGILNSNEIYPVKLDVKLGLFKNDVVVDNVTIHIEKGADISVLQKTVQNYFNHNVRMVVKEVDNGEQNDIL